MTDWDRSQKLGIKGNAVNPDVGKGELATEQVLHLTSGTGYY